jgi:CBS domain-containing protein
MPLNVSIVEDFLAENQETLRDKGVLRHDRHRILRGLRDALDASLKDYESFETELASLVMEKIEHAKTFEELHRCHARAVAGIESFFLEEDTIIDVHDLFRIVRDGITMRVLKLVEEEMEKEGYGPPPTDFVWVGLGSEGRDEQTMMTDQDNMIVYAERNDEFGTAYLREMCSRHYQAAGDGFAKVTGKILLDYYYEVFSVKAMERLNEVGFEKCKGGVMPSNEIWRGSLSDWKERLEQRITLGRGTFELLHVIILTDARAITGTKEMLGALLDFFFAFLTDNKHVMKDFIESAVLMPTALSFFGNFKTEKSGDFKDKFNIKLLGWAPLILAVRMLALSNGIYEPNTLKRIRRLREMNVLKKEMEEDLVDAYLTFVRFRIINQIHLREEGGMNLNYLKPDMLGPEEQEKLRRAMRAVEALQKYIQEVLLFGQGL